KLLQLEKTPTSHQAVSMLIPNFRFRANAFQPFHSDQSDIVPFGLFNNSFGKNVVFVSNAPPFISGEFFQKSFSFPSSLRLHAGPNSSTLFFKFLSFSTRYIKSCISINNIANAKINAHRCPFHRVGIGLFNAKMHIPAIGTFNKGSTRWLFAPQGTSLILSNI